YCIHAVIVCRSSTAQAQKCLRMDMIFVRVAQVRCAGHSLPPFRVVAVTRPRTRTQAPRFADTLARPRICLCADVLVKDSCYEVADERRCFSFAKCRTEIRQVLCKQNNAGAARSCSLQEHAVAPAN